MRLSRTLFLVVLLATVAMPVVAQTGTGRVQVKVTDETDQPFPGVIVTLTSARSLITPQALRTDSQGMAIFGVVPGGQGYFITVEMAGYMKLVDGPHHLQIGKPLMLVFKLQPERVETVKVIGQRTVASLDEPTGSVQISGEFFQDLPILGRNYQSALTMAPGVNDADGDGNPNVHGSRARDFKASVDGVSNVDPLTGTFMSNINPDAIEEIEVVTTAADASYGGAVGGFANIITKQGSNDFEGVVKMLWASWRLNGNGAGSLPAKSYKFRWYQPSASLTGKIVRDKLFYALYHEYLDIGEPISLVGGGGLVLTQERWRHLDKITWQVSARNKLTFQYSADPTKYGPWGIDARTDQRSGVNLEWGGPTYAIEWQTPVSPNFTVKSLIGRSSVGLSYIPLTQGIKNYCATDPYAYPYVPKDSPDRRKGLPIDQDYCQSLDTGTTSGSFYRDYADKRQRWTLKSDATAYVNNFLGKEHTFDFGLVVEKTEFSDDALYYPYSLFAQAASNFIPGQTAEKSASLYRTTFAPGAPDANRTAADGTLADLYFQDTFRPHPTVSIKAGLRFGREQITAAGKVPLDPETETDAFYRAYAICNPSDDPGLKGVCTKLASRNFTAYEETWRVCPPNIYPGSPLCYFLEGDNPVPTRQDERMSITNYNLAPRLNVSWDPKGDGRLKIFGTYAKMFENIFLAVPTVEQGPFYFDLRYPVRSDALYPTGWAVEKNASRVGAPTVSQVSRNLKTPYTNEFTIGISKEIAAETGLTFTYIRRQNKNQLQDIDINHYGRDQGDNDEPCVVQSDGKAYPVGKPDGLYDDCGGDPRYSYDFPDDIPDLWVRNPFFNQIFEVGNYNSSTYHAYQIELLRRLHHDWELEASYVWSKAIGDAEDFLQQLGDDPTTIQDEKGYLEYDQRHLIKINSRIILPVWGLTLGAVARWESGQPYSIIKVVSSDDRETAYGAQTVAYNQTRTVYPTGQRNDHRNDSFYTIDMSLKRDFQIGKVTVTGEGEILNLLNEDRQHIYSIRNAYIDAYRRFGRRFQLSGKVNF